MTAVCAEQRSPAEAQGRGDSGRGTALTWRYDVCQGPVTLAEFDHDCRMTCWYVRGVGVAEGIGDILAEVEVSGENPKPHYYLYNHRGDVLVVLNPDGAANSTFRYDAFENYYQMTGPFTPRYTFSTKEYLPAAGLYLYQYRAYDPIAGRWTQRDPIDYHDSINLYQFCGNNPVSNIDIDGRNFSETVKKVWNWCSNLSSVKAVYKFFKTAVDALEKGEELQLTAEQQINDGDSFALLNTVEAMQKNTWSEAAPALAEAATDFPLVSSAPSTAIAATSVPTSLDIKEFPPVTKPQGPTTAQGVMSSTTRKPRIHFVKGTTKGGVIRRPYFRSSPATQ